MMVMYVQVHGVIRGEHRHAVALLWLAPACSSVMLLGTDRPLAGYDNPLVSKFLRYWSGTFTNQQIRIFIEFSQIWNCTAFAIALTTCGSTTTVFIVTFGGKINLQTSHK